MSRQLADDHVELLRGLDQTIRDTCDEICDLKTPAFVRKTRVEELPKLIALREELLEHDEQAKLAREILNNRCQKVIEVNALIKEGRAKS